MLQHAGSGNQLVQIATLTIISAESAKMGLLFYTYRTGAIDFTIKDVEISKVAK